MKSALIHTVKIFIFIFIVSFILTFLIETMGEDRMAEVLLKDTFAQPFIAALIGLIPNCAASVMITEAYLGGAITFGSMIAGLTSGAGVGVMYLFKRNHNMKQNLGILILMFLIGAISGLVLQVIM